MRAVSNQVDLAWRLRTSVDWTTVTSAALGSGVAVTVAGYLLKTTLEKALDIRVERIRDQNKAEIQEQFRRESLIWNRQYEAARSLLSLIYRSRNTFRDLLSQLPVSFGSRTANRETEEILSRLKGYGDGIVEILYEERAILPRPLFNAAHELKHVQAALFKLGEDQGVGDFPRHAEDLFRRIDSIYSHSSVRSFR
jgi:hypothetical protein